MAVENKTNNKNNNENKIKQKKQKIDNDIFFNGVKINIFHIFNKEKSNKGKHLNVHHINIKKKLQLGTNKAPNGIKVSSQRKN
jgi:hypothetical protein